MVGEEYETHGGAVLNLLELSGLSSLVRRIMAEVGLETLPGEWFPLGKNLEILARLQDALGDEVIFRVGETVPKHAVFPPHIDGVEAALASIDVAFHMNHRKGGVPMFDPRTRSMLEGIGHYLCEPDAARGAVRCVVTSVYPCPFDHGVVTGVAHRFEERAVAAHGGACRSRGDAECLYLVRW